MNGITGAVEGVDRAFFYILGISIVLLVGITITMIVFVIKYRRSRHPVPSDVRGNWKLEVVWTVIPMLIALSMFVVGWSSYTGLRNVPEGAITIQVFGQMYSWIFVYPNDKESENKMVVPLGTPIKVDVTSSDVIHSLFIPSYRIKVDAVPGRHTYAWFLPDKIGVYNVLCAEYCGIGHSDMTGLLHVVPKEEYAKWVESDEDE